MFKYRRAFFRNDQERYSAFLEKVSKGETALHTETLLPYELVTPFFRKSVTDDECAAIDTTWKALPDYTDGENALAVVDGSGSMYGGGDPMPATVALSIGVYFAERSKGAFHNHFITFSMKPQLVEIKGESILEKLRYCSSYNEAANTDLEAVFRLILDAAVKNNVPQSELPEKLYIISDMEFDSCAANAEITNFENAKRMFEAAGYRLPKIVFWNVASRNRQQPVTENEQGVALVSGCSPRIFSMVMDGSISPYEFMLSVVNIDRYAPIAA